MSELQSSESSTESIELDPEPPSASPNLYLLPSVGDELAPKRASQEVIEEIVSVVGRSIEQYADEKQIFLSGKVAILFNGSKQARLSQYNFFHPQQSLGETIKAFYDKEFGRRVVGIVFNDINSIDVSEERYVVKRDKFGRSVMKVLSYDPETNKDSYSDTSEEDAARVLDELHRFSGGILSNTASPSSAQ